jgi:hypothetical protein
MLTRLLIARSDRVVGLGFADAPRAHQHILRLLDAPHAKHLAAELSQLTLLGLEVPMHLSRYHQRGHQPERADRRRQRRLAAIRRTISKIVGFSYFTTAMMVGPSSALSHSKFMSRLSGRKKCHVHKFRQHGQRRPERLDMAAGAAKVPLFGGQFQIHGSASRCSETSQARVTATSIGASPFSALHGAGVLIP